MSAFKSPTIKVEKSAEYIFNILSDLRNLKNIMPKEVAEFEATDKSCSFKIPGVPKLTLIISEKIPFTKISFIAQDSPVAFMLKCYIKELNTENSEVYLELDVELNMMMRVMLEKPLTNLLNGLSEKLKKI